MNGVAKAIAKTKGRRDHSTVAPQCVRLACQARAYFLRSGDVVSHPRIESASTRSPNRYRQVPRPLPQKNELIIQIVAREPGYVMRERSRSGDGLLS